jgi:hypothetical protein
MPSVTITSTSPTAATIRWGTSGLTNYAIVESMEVVSRNIDATIAGNQGFTQVQIMGDDGRDITMTVVADPSADMPAVGDSIDLVLTSTAGIDIGDTASTAIETGPMTCLVTDIVPTVRRDDLAKWRISAEYFTAIEQAQL